MRQHLAGAPKLFENTTSADIYRWVSLELASILSSLDFQSDDASLSQAQENARDLLVHHKNDLQFELAELERNAEWNTFTIAFYGETGAGKSTLIETLRVLLSEPGKMAQQNTFRELRQAYDAGSDDLQRIERALEHADAQLADLSMRLDAMRENHQRLYNEKVENTRQAVVLLDEQAQQLSAAFQQHEQGYRVALDEVARLQALIVERKRTASLWQKLANLFRKLPQELELAHAVRAVDESSAVRDAADAARLSQLSEAEQSKRGYARQLAEMSSAHKKAQASLCDQQTEAEQGRQHLVEQRQESDNQLALLVTKLEQYADGGIIGDGRSDFTRQTQRYDLKLGGQPFALLDVPGIEGSEGLINDQVKQAVQTAHAVFYVTNQAAPPQTGDEQRKGTLQKIKDHLSAQTEVWTIFNKKVTNTAALHRPALTSDDELLSLKGLDEKMHEQLGANYREVFSLTALPAFLASTDHFAPRSQNAKRREKMLNDLDAETLMGKSRLRAFLQFLDAGLLRGSQAKITRANFYKAGVAVRQTTDILGTIRDMFKELAARLALEGDSAQAQLAGSYSALRIRLEATAQRQIDDFTSRTRNAMYELIETDVSNDDFKEAFKRCIAQEQEHLNEQLPRSLAKETNRFQGDVEEIVSTFEKHAHELAALYTKLGSAKLDGRFELKLKLDDGLKITNLLALLVGGVLLWWNPAAWYFIAMGVFSIAVGTYKAVRGFFSSDYRKAQQRKAVEDNLHTAARQLREGFQSSLKGLLPEMQQKVDQIEEALAAPGRQTAAVSQLLERSILQLRDISRHIDQAGQPS